MTKSAEFPAILVTFIEKSYIWKTSFFCAMLENIELQGNLKETRKPTGCLSLYPLALSICG